MRISLGIHIGHDAACAVAIEGKIVAAIQQERLTKVKYDGEEALSNRLPILSCLGAAGIRLSDVDIIVSSFQAVSAGGFGLHKPLIEPSFNVFNPEDPRHVVISHHLAHAWCTYGMSGFDNAAVLVCDLAGSTTIDGKDFALPFCEWYQRLTTLQCSPTQVTETVSFYHAKQGQMELIDRIYCVPHNQIYSYVQSLATLYDNISRFVFRRENAHGQLMALAAYGNMENIITAIPPSALVQFTDSGLPIFLNNWQHTLDPEKGIFHYVGLARACQEATESVLLSYAQQAKKLSNAHNLAVAGGVFLNILGNTRLAKSGIFDDYFVPSTPHDPGIAIGCAVYGSLFGEPYTQIKYPATDQLGPNYSEEEQLNALYQRRHFLEWTSVTKIEIAKRIANGEIVAYWHGRSEFGPRALGSRSLLGSPFIKSIKERLNLIKGRQGWRPVAPIIPHERMEQYFQDPIDSPYMNYSNWIRPEYADLFPALEHPDGSVRVQTLTQEANSELHELLMAFGAITEHPVLINTSLNGAGQPIVEEPSEALDFLLAHNNVDVAVLGTWLVTRRSPWASLDLQSALIQLRPNCTLSMIFTMGKAGATVSYGTRTFQVSPQVFQILSSLQKRRRVSEVLSAIESEDMQHDIYNLLLIGVLEIFQETG